MKFGFVAKHRAVSRVPLMGEALDVSRSGFYTSPERPHSRDSRALFSVCWKLGCL